MYGSSNVPVPRRMRIALGSGVLPYLVMGELVQEPALVHMLNVQDNISVAATARRRHNILIKWEGNEDDDGQEVHAGADGAHALGQGRPRRLAHVGAAEARPDKGRAEPADHGVAEGEGHDGEGERGEEGLAERVGDDGEGRPGEGEEGEHLIARERGGEGTRHGESE